MKQDKEKVPPLAAFYLKLYYAVPRVYLPGTKLDIGFMSCWVALFCVVRTIALQVFYHFGWPQDDIGTLDAVASFVGGTCHSPHMVPMSFLLLKHQKTFRPSAAAKEHPQWWQDATEAMLQLCTGYMVYDFFFLVLTRYIPGEGIVLDSSTVLFMAHHFMTSFYMISARVYGAGAASAFMCIFLGEFTNPPFNAWLIGCQAKEFGFVFSPLIQKAFVATEILTGLFYIPIRAAIAPIVLSYVSYDLFVDQTARKCIPIAVRLLWMFMMAAVCFGSIGHNYLFYDAIMKHMGVRPADGVEQEL